MSAGRTPAPWREGKQKDAVVADVPVDGVQGSDEIDWYGGHLVAESIASHNRPLIIAAPKLLLALEELVAEARKNMVGGAGHLIDNADAVIAEAKGRKVALRVSIASCAGDVRLGTGCGDCPRCRAWEELCEGEDRA